MLSSRSCRRLLPAGTHLNWRKFASKRTSHCLRLCCSVQLRSRDYSLSAKHHHLVGRNLRADVLLNACKYMEVGRHRGMMASEPVTIGSNSYEKVKTFKYRLFIEPSKFYS